MKRARIATLILLAGFFTSAAAAAREQITIVGSSTVYPFVSAAAETFGRHSGFKTPVVEATGTGGGFKLFCSGASEASADITNASRPIKPSEKELCTKNGVKDVIELKIGYDGIVLANSVHGRKVALTLPQIFLALAKEVPLKGGLVANPYKKWSDIDPSLPADPIQVYGPPPTSGTRDAFVEIAMEGGCKAFAEFAKKYPEDESRKKACHLLREDGGYVDAGENDNLIIQKLVGNPAAFGIFGFSFLEENADKVQPVRVNGALPEFEDIAGGSYALARSLYVYAKGEHVGKIPGIKEFLRELTSTRAMGQEGYLANKGLVVLKEEERKAVAAKVEAIAATPAAAEKR